MTFEEKIVYFANGKVFEQYAIDPVTKKRNSSYTKYNYNPHALVLQANYKDDLLHGSYTMFTISPEGIQELSLRCNYSEGKLHGKYESWTTQGYPFIKANYLNGKRDGEYEEWYLKSPHGKHKHLFYVSHQIEEGKIWHPNGVLKTFRDSDSEKRYTGRGVLTQEISFDCNEVDGSHRVLSITTYNGTQEPVREIIYDPEIQKPTRLVEYHKEGRIEQDLKTGKVFRYDINGNLKKSRLVAFFDYICKLISEPNHDEMYEMVKMD
jgi:antitoxin component YwqK of YwqJK toxin-antitoxin module